MNGPADKKLSLKTAVPDVIVATTPTEFIISDGAPDCAPLPGTNLLYVKNTTGNVFKDLTNQNTYVLVTGRWFQAPDLAGPWQYVPGTSLPPDFFKIPDDSPKENVKAAIPKTAQAQEAVIANEIPQTATVYRAKAKFTPVINGAPDLKPIPDTSLMYVFNSPNPIIMVSQYQWYGVQNGVWFTASSAQGPWVVATSIPASIYSIPKLAALLCDIRQDPRCDTAVRGGRLHTRVYGHGRHDRRGGGVRHGIHVCALHQLDGLVRPAHYLRLCGKSNLDSLDRLGNGLRLRLGNGRRLGF